MNSRFDRRVLDEASLELVRACQRRVPCHLGGGAALAGAFLSHRVSRDIDLFCHDATEHRQLVRELGAVVAECGGSSNVQRDGGAFVRAELTLGTRVLVVDLVHEPQADLEPPPPAIESVVVESLADLRASKLTCILSRAEPRDLVDLCFLERAGFPPEKDLHLALKKDAGIDPGILAWLLRQFPLSPLPTMLSPLTTDELRSYRDALAERMRQLAVPRER
ncbi:MAG: nucleotidyl transferase AbiEii/AbiGii toxin family protein [Polyangiaceae bacterium]|nr:nucleotidyl transferase AbiEii/AbiGii toxin family protein [Polyangiaceae bacterium]